MDAPGFPADPSLSRVLLVWLLPLLVAAAALAVAIIATRSRQLNGVARVLSVVAIIAVVVPAFFLFFPTQWHNADGVVECPLSGAAQSVMPGDHDGQLYRFWEPCVAASRLRVGASTGGYAVAAGLIGLVVLRAPKRNRAAKPNSSVQPAVRR